MLNMGVGKVVAYICLFFLYLFVLDFKAYRYDLCSPQNTLEELFVETSMENVTLRELFSLSNFFQYYAYDASKVVRTLTGEYYIGLGKSSGIYYGDIIINRSCAVGIVGDVAVERSQLFELKNPLCIMDVVISRSNIVSTMTGLLIDRNDENFWIQIGDVVYTVDVGNGTSKRIGGIPIGRICRVEDNKFYVEPFYTLRGGDKVFVVKNKV